MKENIIELKNINKQYGDNIVLNNLSLTIKKNEFVTLLGPSGCGKTTTLKIIAGFENSDSGTVLFKNEDISTLPPFKRQLNTVFQKYALFPHMNVYDNIAFGLVIKKLPKSEINKKVTDILNMVSLSGFEKRSIDSLSGGQQQRVAIARALAKKPDILLLDEPLSNLDTKLRVETRQEIRRIQKETGVTAIFVTHDQEEAMCISDEIVLMKDGAIQQISSPSDIYMNPCNKFVASFIGSPEMNFIELNVENGIAKVDSLEVNNLPLDKKNVLMGVRAEDFEVAESGLKTIVKTVEILGRERLLTLTHNETEYKMLVEKEFEIEEGNELIVRPKLGKSYVFDAESEAFITKC